LRKYEIQISEVSETKKKGSREQTPDHNYVFLYSGIDNRLRAKEGDGIVMEEGYRQNVVEWEPANSRIIRINMELEEKISLIKIYAPTQGSEE
jgi:hypothetical protein